jgi:hypothetical protein
MSVECLAMAQVIFKYDLSVTQLWIADPASIERRRFTSYDNPKRFISNLERSSPH